MPAAAQAQQTTGALEVGIIDARDFTGLTAVAALEAVGEGRTADLPRCP